MYGFESEKFIKYAKIKAFSEMQYGSNDTFKLFMK